jgi:hypothetical protein
VAHEPARTPPEAPSGPLPRNWPGRGLTGATDRGGADDRESLPIPYFVRSDEELERWKLSVDAARALASGELAEQGWVPVLARQIYESDIPTG